MKDSIKVAGVTFANEDGTNRQTILANLGKGWHTAKLKTVTFNGDNGPERAVEIRIKGQMIGYVPRTQLTNPLSYKGELTAMVDIYKDKYHVVLSERETPTSREYAAMKSLCLKAGVSMPAYDRRAYAGYWATVKA